MSDTRVLHVPALPTSGLFGGPYLGACARHERADTATIVAGDIRLPALLAGDGSWHTPYGYPQPEGDGALEPLCEAVLNSESPWRLALAPVGRGAELAVLFAMRRPPSAARPIAIHELDDEPPTDRFTAAARSMVRRAQRADAELTAGPVTPAFGSFYRCAMDALGAAEIYRFGDDYFESLNEAGATQLSLRDKDGLAAAAVFIARGSEATYHLSARRSDPPPPPGASNLLVAEGLERSRDAGARVCYLGGGTGADLRDPLLEFKRTMATSVVDRQTFTGPGAGAS
jgi:hypothetical protein